MSITSPNHGASPNRRRRLGFVRGYLCFTGPFSAVGELGRSAGRVVAHESHESHEYHHAVDLAATPTRSHSWDSWALSRSDRGKDSGEPGINESRTKPGVTAFMAGDGYC